MAAKKSILEASRVEFVVVALVRMQAIFVESVLSVGFCKSAESHAKHKSSSAT